MEDITIKNELLKRLKSIYKEDFKYRSYNSGKIKIESRNVIIKFEFYGMLINCGGAIVEGLYLRDSGDRTNKCKKALKEICWLIDCLASFDGRYGIYYTLALNDYDDEYSQNLICKALTSYGWKRIRYEWENFNSNNMITTLIRQVPEDFYDDEISKIQEKQDEGAK